MRDPNASKSPTTWAASVSATCLFILTTLALLGDTTELRLYQTLPQESPRRLSIPTLPINISLPVVSSPQLNNITISNGPKQGDLFAPGSLSLSRLETYHKCYVDPCKYWNHIQKTILCSTSEPYNLTYYMVAKAGSSTARHIMTNSFQAKESHCRTSTTENTTANLQFTIVRDPYSRFLSSYQEALIRSFATPETRYASRNEIPPKYWDSFRGSLGTITTMAEFRDMFDTARGKRRLKRSMQQFIRNYDADLPFDGHLRLQVPRLVNGKTGRTRALDVLLETATMDMELQQLAKSVGAPPPETIHAHARNGGAKINTKNLPVEVRRKICELSAIDYCCLNYELPTECQDVVQCQWTFVPAYPEELLIEAVSQYPPVKDESEHICGKRKAESR